MRVNAVDAAAIVTAIGVAVAAWQLWLAYRQATTAFEDSLSAQYRQLMQLLPVEALLGGSLSEEAHVTALPVFFHYFDFCNEQAFLHKKRRIRCSTWREWREGIEQNLRRPAFARAWGEVAMRVPDSFDELRLVCKPLPLQAKEDATAL